LLLKNNADATIVSNDGKSPLDFAEMYDNQEAFSLLSGHLKPKTSADSSAVKKAKASELPKIEVRSSRDPNGMAFTEVLRISALKGAHESLRKENEVLERLSGMGLKEKRELVLSFVRKGEFNLLQAVITKEPGVLDFEFGPEKNTLLHLSLIYPHFSVFEMLLQQNHQFGRNGEGITPFALSVSLGLYRFSRRLLFTTQELGFDTPISGGNNCLHLLAGAVAPETPSLLFSLMCRGACVDVPNDMGNTPLEVAVRCGNIEGVKVLLDCDVKVTHAAVSIAFETHQSSMLFILAPGSYEIHATKVDFPT